MLHERVNYLSTVQRSVSGDFCYISGGIFRVAFGIIEVIVGTFPSKADTASVGLPDAVPDSGTSVHYLVSPE